MCHLCKWSHHIIPLLLISPLLYSPLQKAGKKKTYSILLLLNYLTSSRPGTKRGGGKHAYWKGALHKALLLCIFMQMTYYIIWESLSCSSSYCPLVSSSAWLYARQVAAGKLLIGFIQKLSKRGNGGVIVLLWHSSKLKMREWWILQSLANIIYIPVSMLMNFGCLRLRWTALSCLSPSSSFIPLYLISSTLNIK